MAITLNEIAYNIKNLAYGGEVGGEENISLRQIKHWIHYHRAKLIADNIDKGIASNHVLWQSYSLSAYNIHDKAIHDYSSDWKVFLDGGSVGAPPRPTDTASYGADGVELIGNMPRRSNHDLNGEWVAQSSMTQDPSGWHQGWLDAPSRDQYGRVTKKSQLRGDFRNIGTATFAIPDILMLQDYKAIKEIALKRTVHHPDDLSDLGSHDENFTQSSGYQHDYISVPLKTIDEHRWSNFNRFANPSNPYALLTKADSSSSINKNKVLVELRGLQVSPNYHNNSNSPTEKIFWKHSAWLRAIFADPTKVIKDRVYSWQDPDQWDDATSPYPIPMEYVKDLIERVITTEISVMNKTMSDELNDAADTTKILQYGAKVQK